MIHDTMLSADYAPAQDLAESSSPELQDTPVRHHLLGLAPLLRAARSELDLTPLGKMLLTYAVDYDDSAAMHDLSIILYLKYQAEAARSMMRCALDQQKLYRLKERDTPDAVRLLVLKTAGDLAANTPVECLLEERNLQVDLLYVDAQDSLDELPPHDLIFVAVCMSQANLPVLNRIEARLENHDRPVINRPDRVSCTSREAAWAMLQDVPGIEMAATRLVQRAVLETMLTDNTPLQSVFPEANWPIIIRPRDLHAGIGLARVSNAGELRTYLAQQDARHFYCAQFIDYSSPDGLFRKYRIVMTQGQAHLCHMGISEHWMVHYPYPEMLASEDRRAEEAFAMQHFDTRMAVQHRAAFAAVAERSDLDYIGFDCAETQDGKLLIFEIATGMVIHDMDDPQQFPYKQAQMQRTFNAFNQMLISSANRGTWSADNCFSSSLYPRRTVSQTAAAGC